MLTGEPIKPALGPSLESLEFTSADDPLIVRQLVPADAQELFDLIRRNRKPLAESWFVDGRRPPDSVDEVAENLNSPPMPGILRFATWYDDSMIVRIDVVTRENGKPTEIPTEDTEAEIGFFADEKFQGNALASRSAMIVMRGMPKRFGIKAFTAEVKKDNPYKRASARSLTKAGFSQLPDSDGEYLLFRKEHSL